MNNIAKAIQTKESWKKKFGISNVAALVIVVVILAAAGIVVYGVYGGGGNTTTGTSNTGSSNTLTSSSTGTGTSNTKTTTQTLTQSGVLSVLISDPPHLPNGVSALFITYPNMYVHVAGLPQAEGWIQLSSSGWIQLLGAVNIGQTVASASIPADEYNMIRFNVSSAVVTNNNQNYTAVIPDLTALVTTQ